MEKKIFVLTSTFPVNSNDKVPTFVRDQVIQFKKNNPDCVFFVIAPNVKNISTEEDPHYFSFRFRYFFNKFEILSINGIMPTIKQNYLFALLIPFFILSQFIYTYILVKKYKPNHIYAHWVTPQAITALLINKLTKIPYSFSSHAHDAEILKHIPYFGVKLLNSIVKNSNKFTFDSQNTKRKLKKYVSDKNWEDEKSMVLPMGANTELFNEAKKINFDEIKKNNKIKIAYLGRFAEKKGVENLIKAIYEINKESSFVELIICGRGPLEKNYRKLINELNLNEDVILLNFFNDIDKLFSIYSLADVIVVPSIQTKTGDVEGLPVVAIEALYLKKILVASNQSNVGEIIVNNESGFLFNSNNNFELINILTEILNDKYDLNKIAKKGHLVGQKYSITNTSKMYFQHLFN